MIELILDHKLMMNNNYKYSFHRSNKVIQDSQRIDQMHHYDRISNQHQVDLINLAFKYLIVTVTKTIQLIHKCNILFKVRSLALKLLFR